MIATTSIQDDLREIAAELIDGHGGREEAGKLLALADEIDRATDIARAASTTEIQRSHRPPRELGYQRSTPSGHGGSGITWNHR